ncbi:hypothetical protein GCM10009760_27600 [Kitasatospora kazusensis]|uniref:Uncharacterized protein n=1 Tax=Kitasatospora kazusensis TaxID=407974 RepID=A0ABN2ZHS8_9ACTN
MLIARTSRGAGIRKPSRPAIRNMLANLRRGNSHLVLERTEENLEGDWYIQVRLRDNNIYELEYRDGVPAVHYQTLTVSLAKVTDAFIAWADGRTDWKAGFMWTNIGSRFMEQADTAE